jgi:hypothetical protein
MPLDVVGEIYLSTDESTASDTNGKYIHLCFTMFTCYIMTKTFIRYRRNHL